MFGEVRVGADRPRERCVSHVARLELILSTASAADIDCKREQQKSIEGDVQGNHGDNAAVQCTPP
jgi:hypothetical protein